MKVNVNLAIAEMMEYRLTVSMVKNAMDSPKHRSRLKLVLARLVRYTPEDQRKFLNVREVPPSGLANMEVRNFFFAKSQAVVKAALLAINIEYLPKYNEVLRRAHEEAQCNRAIKGLKVKTFKEQKQYRNEIGKLVSMIEKVEAYEKRQQKNGRTAITGHFLVQPKKK